MDNPNDVARNQLREYRLVVADVVSELRAQEVRDTYAGITLLELAEQHLKVLSSGSENKLGRLERLTRVRDTYKQKIEGLKSTEPAAFRSPDPSADANTAP